MPRGARDRCQAKATSCAAAGRGSRDHKARRCAGSDWRTAARDYLIWSLRRESSLTPVLSQGARAVLEQDHGLFECRDRLQAALGARFRRQPLEHAAPASLPVPKEELRVEPDEE